MFRVLFHQPAIAGNTGNTIRLAAGTGVELHLVEPLGFDFSDAKLRRAGLDYHDLAVVTVHPDLETALGAMPDARVYAFTTSAHVPYTDIAYEPGDILLFGTEPTGYCPEHTGPPPEPEPRWSDGPTVPQVIERAGKSVGSKLGRALKKIFKW